MLRAPENKAPYMQSNIEVIQTWLDSLKWMRGPFVTTKLRTRKRGRAIKWTTDVREENGDGYLPASPPIGVLHGTQSTAR